MKITRHWRVLMSSPVCTSPSPMTQIQHSNILHDILLFQLQERINFTQYVTLLPSTLPNLREFCQSTQCTLFIFGKCSSNGNTTGCPWTPPPSLNKMFVCTRFNTKCLGRCTWNGGYERTYLLVPTHPCIILLNWHCIDSCSICSQSLGSLHRNRMLTLRYLQTTLDTIFSSTQCAPGMRTKTDFFHSLVPYYRESHWNAYVGAGVTWVRTIILPFLNCFTENNP